MARVEELKNCRLLRGGFNPSFSMKADRMRGVHFETREPDNDDLRSFLVTFRQFISNDEPVYLFKVYNLCHQYLTSEELKGYLIESRQIWQRELKQGGIRLMYNGCEVTPERITDLWINGYYFHNDPEKIRILRNLLPHESMLTRYIFLDHLIEATREVLYVGFIIKVAFRDCYFRNLN